MASLVELGRLNAPNISNINIERGTFTGVTLFLALRLEL